jgi:hypothetical protein
MKSDAEEALAWLPSSFCYTFRLAFQVLIQIPAAEHIDHEPKACRYSGRDLYKDQNKSSNKEPNV